MNIMGQVIHIQTDKRTENWDNHTIVDTNLQTLAKPEISHMGHTLLYLSAIDGHCLMLMVCCY